MNAICKEEFNKAKNLIKLRKENIDSFTTPEVQNLDSGILLQYFENWENVEKEYNNQKVDVKKRIFELYDDDNIVDVTMYFTDDFNLKSFNLEYNVIYLNLDGSFDIEVNGEMIHVKAFSVISLKKGDVVIFKNVEDINYLISIRYISPIL